MSGKSARLKKDLKIGYNLDNGGGGVKTFLSIAQIDTALFKRGLSLPSASDPGSNVVFETLMVSGSPTSFLSFGSDRIFTCVIKQIKKHCNHLKNISQNSKGISKLSYSSKMYDFAIVQCDSWKLFFFCSAKCGLVAIDTVLWGPSSILNA